jgi:WD40 repeat protein
VWRAGRDGRIAIWSCAKLCAEEVVQATWGAQCSACDGIDLGKRACVCAVAHGSDDDTTEAAMCAQVGRTLVVSIEAQMAVCSLTWSSDESVVVAAGLQDNTARAWHVPSGMPAQALAPLQRMVSVVEWLAGHWLCAGGGGDEVIVLWSIDPVLDAGTGAPADPVARLATGGRTVISLSCSSDGKHLVALLSGQVLRFFDLERITQELALKRQEHQNTQLSYVNQAWFGAGGIENELSRPSNGLSVPDVQAVRGGSLVLAPAKLPPALKYLASSPYPHVRAFECFLEINEPIAGLSYISSVVMATPFPRDRIILNCVSVHSEPLVVELDTCSGQVLQNFRGHRMQRFVSGMAVGGPGEAIVCAGSEDGCVMLWQRQTGKPVKVLIGHQGAVNCLSWCQRDGGAGLPYLLASASDDYSVRIWGPLIPSSPSFAQGARQQADAANGEAPLNRLLAKLAASSPDASPVAPSRKLGRTAGASDRPA